MLLLIVVSFALLIAGFVLGYTANDGLMTDVLLYWAYIMIAVTLAAVIVIGLIISITSNPKVLIKIGIGVVGVAVVCAVAYFLAPGSPAMGMLNQPTESTLKLTDTILNLTYIVGGAAVLAIVVGELRMTIISKKK